MLMGSAHTIGQAAWTAVTAARVASFAAAKERHVRVYGPETADSLLLFYTTVAQLFFGGRLGGVKIRAHKTAAAFKPRVDKQSLDDLA